MRQRDLDHLQELGAHMERGTLGKSEVVSLFILIRELSPVHSSIRDIGHCVAHADRDRGVALEHINKFLGEILAQPADGRVRFEVQPLYPIETVIAEIGAVFATLGLTLDVDAVLQHETALAYGISEMIAGTNIKVDDPRLVVRFEHGPQPLWTINFLEPIYGPIRFSPSNPWGLILLMSTKAPLPGNIPQTFRSAKWLNGGV